MYTHTLIVILIIINKYMNLVRLCLNWFSQVDTYCYGRLVNFSGMVMVVPRTASETGEGSSQGHPKDVVTQQRALTGQCSHTAEGTWTDEEIMVQSRGELFSVGLPCPAERQTERRPPLPASLLSLDFPLSSLPLEEVGLTVYSQ